jgi:hypothetical protein
MAGNLAPLLAEVKTFDPTTRRRPAAEIRGWTRFST